MRDIPREVQRENEYLRRQLGTEHGRARYRWAWSEDLTMPMILIDDLGAVVFDYHCRCGVNVSVHAAGCNWTTPRPKWTIRKLAPDLQDQWVIAKWVKPEASRDDWEATFGGVPYPAEGYLVPFGTQNMCVAINPGQVPFRETTEMIVQAIKEHAAKSEAERNAETKDAWKTREAKKHEEYRLKCKDAFPVHTGFPGSKEEWSHGGIGESPALRKGGDAPLIVTGS